MPRAFTPAQAFDEGDAPDIATSPVESHLVASRGYDVATQTLALTFVRTPGVLYAYPDVSKETFDEFVGADSAGTFFGKHLKALPFKKFRIATAAA